MGSRKNPTMASRSRGAVLTCVEPVSFGEMILGGGGGEFPARRGVMKGFFLEVQGPRECMQERVLSAFLRIPPPKKEKRGGFSFDICSPVDHVFGDTPRKTRYF